MVNLPSLSAHSLTGFWRDIGKIVSAAGRHARREVQPKPKFVEKSKFDPDEGRRKARLAGGLEAGSRGVKKPWMRIAFRQNLQKPGKRRYARERELIVKNARRGRFRQLGCIDAELIVESRTPFHLEAISCLKNGADAP